jgi:hypothetical protein
LHGAAHLDARAVGQTDIHNGHVRDELKGPRYGIDGRTRIADNVNSLRFEEIPKALPHEHVVVDNDDAKLPDPGSAWFH